MGIKFWFKRAAMVFSIVSMLLLLVELAKGHVFEQAILFALTWGAVSTAIFIGTRLYYTRKGVHCELCNDLPTKPAEGGIYSNDI
ncbi:hypothetical protein KO525_18610 [Psychrosphaera sp. B3R10]|uniref:hypothetical protein n=1 Tax=unclassified Psychrosphaera TaxID=2641570 RepID=UPI001C0919C0|nr:MULTISPECIES: hypothetical protein [unclassified Psychrosphaera]MBU2883002.1 hypothetical protein [Psychrosphaera sp. I2R16]MBU2991399.1 hypothetical protein [Psychrosphaera sp. B3R10]